MTQSLSGRRTLGPGCGRAEAGRRHCLKKGSKHQEGNFCATHQHGGLTHRGGGCRAAHMPASHCSFASGSSIFPTDLGRTYPKSLDRHCASCVTLYSPHLQQGLPFLIFGGGGAGNNLLYLPNNHLKPVYLCLHANFTSKGTSMVWFGFGWVCLGWLFWFRFGFAFQFGAKFLFLAFPGCICVMYVKAWQHGYVSSISGMWLHVSLFLTSLLLCAPCSM